MVHQATNNEVILFIVIILLIVTLVASMIHGVQKIEAVEKREQAKDNKIKGLHARLQVETHLRMLSDVSYEDLKSDLRKLTKE